MANDQPAPQQNLHAMGLLDNKGGGDGGGGGGGGGGAQARDLANEQMGTHDISRMSHLMSQAMGIADMIGLNIGSLFSHGGLFQGFDTQGLGGKMINSIMDQTNMRGGFIANLMHSIFIKNLNDIKDQSSGVGGGGQVEAPQIAAASGGSSFAEISGAVSSGGGRFESASMPMSSLGDLQPMSTPIMTGGRGAGMMA